MPTPAQYTYPDGIGEENLPGACRYRQKRNLIPKAQAPDFSNKTWLSTHPALVRTLEAWNTCGIIFKVLSELRGRWQQGACIDEDERRVQYPTCRFWRREATDLWRQMSAQKPPVRFQSPRSPPIPPSDWVVRAPLPCLALRTQSHSFSHAPALVGWLRSPSDAHLTSHNSSPVHRRRSETTSIANNATRLIVWTTVRKTAVPSTEEARHSNALLAENEAVNLGPNCRRGIAVSCGAEGDSALVLSSSDIRSWKGAAAAAAEFPERQAVRARP